MSRLMIASDLHGDAETTEKLLKVFAESGAEKLILLGDLLYHGPRNDLPAGYAPKRVIEMLNAKKDSLLCVRGNCEAEVDQMVLDFPVMADFQRFTVGGVSFYATHGHHKNRENPPRMKRGEVLLTGHTHVPVAVRFGRKNLHINPGSVSIPKEDSPRSYVLYEDGHFSFLRLEDGAEYKSASLEK